MMALPRTVWGEFPDVFIHADERIVKRHPDYLAAKTGDAAAAGRLVAATLNEVQVAMLQHRVGENRPILVSVHACETTGVNAIPEALADALSDRLEWLIDENIIQINVVGHTGADGYTRLAHPARFDGEVMADADYVLVDDFIGQGGTLANLRGHLETHGARVIAATALTGKPYSAKLRLDPTQLHELRMKHGDELEVWWRERFGYGFNCLTQSEARYLAHSPDAHTIRNRIIAAEQARNRPSSA